MNINFILPGQTKDPVVSNKDNNKTAHIKTKRYLSSFKLFNHLAIPLKNII